MIYNDNNSTSKVFYSGFTITSVYACGGELVWSSSPYAFKAMYTLNNGTTGQVSCNSSSVLRGSDYDSYETYHNIKDLVIGECVDNLNGHIYDSVRTVDMSHSNLTVLDDDFMGSSYLRDVTFANGITTIGASCFENCSSLSSITIPSSVTTIGMMAFRQAGLVEATVHSGITYSYYVFQRCPLTSVTIEEGVSEIPNGMFAGCSALTEVTIPSTVQYIGEYGFANTYAITSITCLATTPPNLGSDAFYGYIEYPIYVPCSAMAAYLAHSDWQPFIDRLRPIENQCESIQYRWQPSGTTCVGVDKYNNNIKQISYNSGTTWSNVSPSEYSASTLIERNSTDCGYIEPQYRTISTAVTCSGVDKYKVDEHQESLDGGVTWTTTSTTIGDLVQANSYDCGYRTRTLTTATTCSGVDKYRLEEYQVSTDSGTTWTTTGTSATTLIEANSYDCGYRTRQTSGTPYCVDVDKYQDVYSEYSTDSGTTWITASTTPTLLEHNSEDCGYVPPIEPQYRTLTTATTCVGYDKHVLEEHQESLDGGVTWTTTATTTGSLIEADSEDCGYVPPTPIGFKFKITHSDNYISSAACDSTSSITRSEILSTFVDQHTTHTARAIEIGDCVTEVASAACSSMENVTAVTIPNSVTTIGDKAFERLDSVSTLTIPNSVISIGNSAFLNWKSISSVTIPDSVQTIGNAAFSQNGYAGVIKPCINHFEVGSGVTYIGSGAFSIDNENLTVDVIMHPTTPPSLNPNGNPFVTFGDAVYHIYLPNAAWDDYMADSQWSSMRSYTNIHFYTIDPEYRTVSTATTCVGVDKYAVDEYQVSYDMWQTYTTTGSSVTTLIEADSEDCGYVPPIEPQYRTLTTATTCVGYDKYTLEEYQVSTDGGVTWTTTGSSATTLIEADSEDCGYVPPTPTFDGKWKLTLNDTSVASAACGTAYITQSEVSSYQNTAVALEIGSCCTELRANAFMRFSNLETCNLGSGVIRIGANSFNQCTSLTEITIPDNVTTIDYLSFYGCSSLSSVTIGSGVTYIGSSAFVRCTNLNGIIINALTPPQLDTSVFNETNNCGIYVPSGSVNAYKAAWSDYASRIQAIP